MEIKKSMFYNQFKLVEGNRSINIKHVRALKNSIRESNLSSVAPIVINEKFEIIDGQHRFRALKELGKPIHYVVQQGLKMEDIQLLNSASKNWSLEDYLKSYVAENRLDYIKFDEYVKEYNIPVAVALNILYDNPTSGGSQGIAIRKQFISGRFSISARAYSQGRVLFDAIKEMMKLNKVIGLGRCAMSLCAMVKRGMDLKKFMKRFQSNSGWLVRCSGQTDYYKCMERIYNFRNSNPFYFHP